MSEPGTLGLNCQNLECQIERIAIYNVRILELRVEEFQPDFSELRISKWGILS